MRKVELSKVYRLLYPTVPAVVAATSGEKTEAMPVVSMISLSNNPPLVGIASSPSHATFHAILNAGSFTVSWLDRKFRYAIDSLGTNSGWDVPDKLLGSGLRYRVEGSPPVPILAGASAYIICSVNEVRKYGDHELVVGRVAEARAVADFHEYWQFSKYKPIIYTGLGRSSTRPRRAPVKRS